MKKILKDKEKQMFEFLYGEEEARKVEALPKIKLPDYSDEPPKRKRFEIDKRKNQKAIKEKVSTTFAASGEPKEKRVIKPDFTPVKDLFLTYPKGFKHYDELTDFYKKLIITIPEEIRIFLIVNNKEAEEEIKTLFPNKNLHTVLIQGFQEIWLRDVLGFNTGINRIYKPVFKPDYCKYIYTSQHLEELETQVREIFEKTIKAEVIEMPLVLDGGNLVTNGKVGFLTEKVIKDNPEVKNYIEKILFDFLGIRAIIVESSKYDVLGHIDGYISFLNENTVCLSKYPEIAFLKKDIEIIEKIERALKSEGLEVVPIYDRPIDEKVIGGGQTKDSSENCLGSARGIFVNHLILNKTIILPEYTIPNYKKKIDYNQVNKKTLKELGFNVVTINCDQLGRMGGSIHCISFTN
jgi:agmatine/peptidylarginine deiminase